MKLNELTRREIECLKLAAEDKTISQTANLLLIGYETVKWHRSLAISKLGCRSITGAVYTAIRRRLLT